MKKLPLGIQNFPEIRNDDYVYIDKTKIAYNLIATGKYYFLSRPRRFGKSLFLDTLKCLFEGKKQLFNGLYVYDKWDWDKKYPVIKISFGAGIAKDTKKLTELICLNLLDSEKENQVTAYDKSNYSTYFKTLITACYKKYNTPVVLLIDEYYPYGKMGGVISLPPAFNSAIYFKAIYSHYLSEDTQNEKIL
ncbi:MAG: AAA family ATPase, partial [Desulfamplus sp.]|nr:AAA family ATPase [Desulfamplus sp.]